MIPDDILELIFGPPNTAAADLNELRIWAHGRTALTPTHASATGRELCVRIDPTWPARGLTNERITLPPGSRPRGYGYNVKVAESTIETMSAVSEGLTASTTVTRTFKLFETLWPAQCTSWQTWVMQAQDTNQGLGGAEMRNHNAPLMLPYIHPASFMMAVRSGGTPYLDAVAGEMVLGLETWKFACIPGVDELWTAGLCGFRQEWLDLFPRGELAMWLRSTVCCGWFCSYQLARYMGLPSARSCRESWI